jgi:hypothetical protein
MAQQLADGYEYRRATGGILWHIVIRDINLTNGKALCGFAPSSPPARAMREALPWLRVEAVVDVSRAGVPLAGVVQARWPLA